MSGHVIDCSSRDEADRRCELGAGHGGAHKGRRCALLDRVMSTIDRLGDAGILMAHAGCCLSCGHEEMRQRLHDFEPGDAGEPFGYAFFHDQDASDAESSGAMFIAYEHRDGSSVGDGAVAINVISALAHAGLKTEWDGDTSKRIFVRGVAQ